jgi:nitroreductase
MATRFFDLLHTRYSVRSYQDKEIEDALLEKVLEAGRLAPSAVNNQPWSFIVIRENDSRKRLESVYNREWFLSAPVIIAVCYDRSLSWKRSDGKDFGEIDASIAMTHMILAATELGLGTCWIGAFNAREAKKVLMLPESVEAVAFTPLGFPISAKPPVKSRKNPDEIVHWEFYGGKKQ